MRKVTAARLAQVSVDLTGPHGRRRHLHGINLTLEPGILHAVVGESGAGKSLSIATMTGMLPPTARVHGHVVVQGLDLTTASASAWRRVRGRLVGVVPQSPLTHLTPMRTVGAQLREVDPDADPRELCDRVGLDHDVLRLRPYELSGGMAQRVGVACALAGAPRVILADEPTSARDPELKVSALQLLRERADAGVAVLLVTHDLDVLLDTAVADTATVLLSGHIEAQGTAEEVFSRPDGYVGRLLRALPRHGLHP